MQHMGERVKRLEQAIVEVVKLAPAPVQEVIRGLQALRGVAHISAVTIAAELGNISSRFENARALMGYSGVFPSEDSSGERIRKGSITKAGNAHLRRIVVESATIPYMSSAQNDWVNCDWLIRRFHSEERVRRCGFSDSCSHDDQH